MCGIIGYIGEKQVESILINGLKRLEYRGYDSAGIAFLNEGNLGLVKCKGKLEMLEDKLRNCEIKGNLGIGHTRWATHGEPNDINSHPHLSHKGRIAVVHNGIIENYLEIKEFLIEKGYEFISETDTEVISNLIEFYYNGDILQTSLKAIREIKGSFALGVISKENPDEFIAARKDSPLIVGIGDDGNFIASDIPAILEHTRKIYILEDNEVVRLTRDNVQVFNSLGMEVKKDVLEVTWDISSAEKGGYEHFMMKEIMEQPCVIRNTINTHIQNDLINFEKDDFDRIFIVACGTAFHAGLIGKEIIENLARIPVEVQIASEFRYKNPIINKNTLVIVISQSGETLDTLFSLREAKSRGAQILSIVNVIGSSIARESNDILYTYAGPEISVASTKAYTAQLTVLYLLALKLALKKGTISDDFFNNTIAGLRDCPEMIEQILEQCEVIQRFASKHFNSKNVFFIGRNLDYALAMEGSLKLKELSYIHSEAYAGGELKHGTIALIEKGTLVVCSVTQNTLIEKMIGNIREVKARGATVLVITQKNNRDLEKVGDEIFYIPSIDSMLAPIAAIVPMQLLAYYMAAVKGCDIDKPRHLAKSVTVE